MDVQLKYDKNIGKNYIEELLLARGLKTELLNVERDVVQDPSSLDNIEEGVELLSSMCKNKAKMLIVVDSDADGYCSSAIIYQYIKDIYPEVEIDHICHEGKQHGLEDIHKVKELSEYDLVILPDAGSNDGDIFTKYPGVKFLVIDHHETSDENIYNIENAVVINNQLSKDYQNKSLCGAGMAWQFISYMSKTHGGNPDYYLDLAAVATVADVMKVTTLENRYILNEGLSNINNPFIKELISIRSRQISNVNFITPETIGWYISPLINGMCRSGRFEEKMRMFEAFIKGDELMQDLKRGAAEGDMVTRATTSGREASNAKSRQDTKKRKMSEIAETVIAKNDLLNNKIIILELDELFGDMPPELNGLVANQISQKYNRPTLVIRKGPDNVLKGSARGINTVKMDGLKDLCVESGLCEFAEGHQNAHGVGIKETNKEKFLDWFNNKMKDVDFNNTTWQVDFIRNADQLDLPELIYTINNHEYLWGANNPVPLIYVQDINLNKSEVMVMGAKRNTVKIIKHGVEYIFFNMQEEEVDELTSRDSFQLKIVGTMGINSFNGKVTPQIKVTDYQIIDEADSF